MNSEEIISTLEKNGLKKKNAIKFLREVCEISVTTGAQMLAEQGIPYDVGIAYLNTMPQFGEKKPSIVTLRKVFGLFFLVGAALNLFVLILRVFDAGSFRNIGNGRVVVFIIFSILGRHFYRERKAV